MKKNLLFVIVIIFSISVFGQSYNNVLQPAMPFLTINSTGRILGFGDINVVSSEFYSDAGLFGNPSLLSNNSRDIGAYYSYMPWMKNVVEGMNFKNFGAYGAINSKHAIGISAKYFNLGVIEMTNDQGEYLYTEKPKEYFYQLTYKYSFNPKVSFGADIKYIESSLSSKSKKSTFAIDLGFNYRNTTKIKTTDIKYNLGAAISNFGPRIKYDDFGNNNSDNSNFESFLPATIMIGGLINPTFILKEDLKLNIEIAYQAEKLLVPTPPVYDTSGYIISGKDPDISPFRALYQSFYDAPGGFKEEWHEIIHKIGNEYRITYKDKYHLAFRWGISREHQTKGNRKYNYSGVELNVRGVYLSYTSFHHISNKNSDTGVISLGARMSLGDL
jgi:hypothetical protein